MKLIFTCHSKKYISVISERRKTACGAAEPTKPVPSSRENAEALGKKIPKLPYPISPSQ